MRNSNQGTQDRPREIQILSNSKSTAKYSSQRIRTKTVSSTLIKRQPTNENIAGRITCQHRIKAQRTVKYSLPTPDQQQNTQVKRTKTVSSTLIKRQPTNENIDRRITCQHRIKAPKGVRAKLKYSSPPNQQLKSNETKPSHPP